MFKHDGKNRIPKVELDRLRMKHVILNLVKNAEDAMPNGGRLTISTSVQADLLNVKMVDTGMGIEPKDLENIFQPFYSTKRRGHGLGLSIVHQTIRDHGGDIKIQSEVGKGTEVIVHLPMHQRTGCTG